MFSRSSRSPNNASPALAKPPRSTDKAKGSFSVIGADVVIIGDIRAEADLHIDGRVEGDIVCASLVQGANSHIKGHIQTASAKLCGHVEGAIDASELVIEGSARITGDISYDSITVAPGAHVDGRFSHKAADLRLVSNGAEANV